MKTVKTALTDEEIGEAAETEAEATLNIIRLLKPWDKETRQRLMNAAQLLIEADKNMPGVVAAFVKGSET